MAADARSRSDLGARDLPPNIFAIVMATGIVSLALHAFGHELLAHLLFWLNVGCYTILSILLLVRAARYRGELAADLASHAKAPGFFTLVAAPCVLGNKCVLIFGATDAGLALWVVGLAFWLLLSYAMLPGLIEGMAKPKPETGISGVWLLVVVGTQAISMLAGRLAPGLAPHQREVMLFVALTFWLVGSMLYLWLIALIFHRMMFLPLSPSDLAPPYWINMGAMAISTLSGVCLIDEAGRVPLLTELLPFLKGMTLLFWATATWWIPVLFVLGIWRHALKRVPFTYDHGYWGAVFPLGMYTVCTHALSRTFRLSFLDAIPAVFVWIALTAWVLTFLGLMQQIAKTAMRALTAPSIFGRSRGR